MNELKLLKNNDWCGLGASSYTMVSTVTLQQEGCEVDPASGAFLRASVCVIMNGCLSSRTSLLVIRACLLPEIGCS